MSSVITGLGSGFDINGWVASLVSAKQSTMLSPLQEKLNTLQTKSSALTSLKAKFTTLQSSLQTFSKTVYNSSSDMWNKSAVETSNKAYATATSTGSVAAAKVDLEIEQIATSTVAKSIFSLGASDKESIENTKFTNLANGQAKVGTFSLFLDNKEYEVKISEEDTLKNVMDNIYSVTEGKVKAEVDEVNGNFSIKAVDENSKLSLGSAGDTSNIVSALKLHTEVGEYGYTSSYPISTIKTDLDFNDINSGLSDIKFYDAENNPATSGKIFINGEEIEVKEDMSLNELITKINNNSDTKVKASYDALTNKLILTSTTTGTSNISLSSDGTNILNVLGLTTGSGEEESIAQGSQELGKNAIVYINDNKVISNSNTITGESSGIANLSITVKKPTSEYSKNSEDDKNVTLDISSDYSAVKSALEKFVTAYNDVVSTTETLTASDGKIGRDSTLTSIVSQLKSITSKVSENDGVYSMLAQVGIESDKENLSMLKIDSSKLDKALNDNIDSVKQLLSDGYTAKEDTGVFDQILKNLNSVLDVEKGYFVTEADGVQSLINSTNTRIERANTKLASYEARITKQFNQMDSTIAALNSQLSTFMSYMG